VFETPVAGAAKHCEDGSPPWQSSAVVWPVLLAQTLWSDESWHTAPPQLVAQNCCSQLAKYYTAAWPPGCAVMQPLVHA
jgi:hypothetical protein